jgi:hypothetical protein
MVLNRVCGHVIFEAAASIARNRSHVTVILQCGAADTIKHAFPFPRRCKQVICFKYLIPGGNDFRENTTRFSCTKRQSLSQRIWWLCFQRPSGE